MVGILRSDDGDSRSVGTSSLKSLEDLESEPPVVVKTDVDLDSLPSPVASALYRITQESITNARRHNRNVTSIEVQVTSRLDHVELQVSNDGTPTTRSSDSGYGLIGMQERVTALEGTFESGQRPGNGWQTLVTIPLRGSA
jgi:signal transduction histidine kinase